MANLNNDQNIVKSRIQKLLSSKQLSDAETGVALLKESDDPVLLAFFSQGLSIGIRLEIDESSKVFKWVKAKHRPYIALCILNQCKQLQNISSLDLDGWKSLTNLDALKGCTSLKRLDLYGCTSLTHLGALKDCPKLSSLSLRHCTTLSPAMRKSFTTKADIKKVLSMWEFVWKPSYKDLLTPFMISTLNDQDIDQLAHFKHANPEIQALQHARYIALKKGKSSKYLTQLKKMLNIKKIHPDVAAFIEASMPIKSMKTLSGLNGFAEKAIRGFVKNDRILKGLPHTYDEEAYFPVLWLSSDMFVAIETGQVIFLHHDATFYEVLYQIISGTRPPKKIQDLVTRLAHYGSEMDLRQLVVFESLCFQTCKNWPSISSAEQKKVFSTLYKIQLRSRSDLKREIRYSYGYEFLHYMIRDYLDGV